MSHQILDVRGQLCPIPVIRCQSRIGGMSEGETLEVLCTDPGTLHDIPAWCRIHGHKVLKTSEENREIRILVEVCG